MTHEKGRIDMRNRMEGLKRFWLIMLTPPWRDVESGEDKLEHTLYWVIGWAWALAGILLGAVIAPYLLGVWGLADSSYQDILVIGIASLAGILVQFLGWCLVVLAVVLGNGITRVLPTQDSDTVTGVIVLVFFPLPLVAVGYAIYLYATTIGAQSGLITTGVVGGILVKLAITLGVPLVKGLIFGLLLGGFIRWLRGDKAK